MPLVGPRLPQTHAAPCEEEPRIAATSPETQWCRNCPSLAYPSPQPRHGGRKPYWADARRQLSPQELEVSGYLARRTMRQLRAAGGVAPGFCPGAFCAHENGGLQGRGPPGRFIPQG